MASETLSPLENPKVHYRQTIMPDYRVGTFAGDDTDNHDYVFQGRGKASIQAVIDNPSDAELTYTLYGMHEADGAVGDPGTVQIDTGPVAAAGQFSDSFLDYNYPYYLLRLAFAVAPTDDPAETITTYIDMVS